MAERHTARNTDAATAPARSRFQDTIRSLKYRNFQLFFSGQLISLVGTWMQNVAQAWLVYRMTGSSVLLGVVSFAGQIPVVPLAPLAGMVADRMDRRKVVIATQTASMVLALVLAVLTLTKLVDVWEVVVLAALMGVVNSFDIPARQSFLVEMVGREDLMNAIALNSSMFNGARIIGPAIAGILVASIGEGWCFFANGVSYIAVIVGLLMMRMPHRRIERKGVSALEHIAEGFRYARQTGPIRALLLLLGLVSLVAMPYTVLMPIFAAQILHGNARTLGVLGAATGVGALGGALTLASRTKVHDLGRWVAIACGAALIGFGLSRWYILSVIMLVPVGFAMMTQMGACNTLVQAMVPDRLRGRIMAVYAMMFMGMAPLGALLSGEVADHIGAQWTVALGGALTVAGAIVFAQHLPKIHVEVGELITAQSLEADDSVQQMAARIIS